MRSTFHCIDAHTCGNPVRVVVSGGPDLQGNTMAERRAHFLRDYDWIRTGLMFEPRGHDQMSGSLLYPPSDPGNDAGILFIETSGCLPMCGHGTIGTVTVMIEAGLLKPKVPGRLRLEVPAGIVEAAYHMEGERVVAVRIANVASFLAARDLDVEVPGLGPLKVDVAYGGNFYAIVDPQEGYPGLEAFSASQLVAFGRELRKKVNEGFEFAHPERPEIRGCSHVLWTGAPRHPEAHARNAVLYGEKALDRSPCGTGTSARMAQWAARGRLKPGDDFVHESLVGSLFRGRVETAAQVGPYPAILPSIEGWAIITGHNTLFLDDADPFVRGFQVL